MASRFLIVLPDSGLFAYADCPVSPGPDQAQLPDIALCTSRMCANLTGQIPVVAMLSFATKASGEHPAVKDLVQRNSGTVSG